LVSEWRGQDPETARTGRADPIDGVSPFRPGRRGDVASPGGSSPGAGRARGHALSKAQLAANDLKLVARIFGAAMRLMSGVAFAVGALVVGLVIFTATVERQREYGVLKALGARSARLYRVVTVQALAAAGAGAAVGLMLLAGAVRLLEALRPQFLIVVEPGDVLAALGVAGAMALLGALAPARAVAGLAPADVFRR
jgi:ABC-type antimicrobial peptide transport system permease subunit